jgi:phenylalanyl-tRNA synthetase beta chain
MRTSGATSMVGAVEWNLNHGQKSVRLFEFGKAYEVCDGKPVETRTLSLGATGLAQEQSIHEPAREFSFADLKGDVDALLSLAGGAQWQLGGPEYLARGHSAQISLSGDNGKTAGAAGQLSRSVAQKLKLRQDVYLAGFWVEPLLEAVAKNSAALRYDPLPRFPAVERDFSLTLADGKSFGQIEEAIRTLSISELRRVEAVDLFRGGQIPAGKYSLLLRVTFQSESATLTEAQLSDFSARIASALSEKLGATLRA